MRMCNVEGCNSRYRTTGFCVKHYNEYYRNSEKGKAAQKKFRESDKYIPNNPKYRESNKISNRKYDRSIKRKKYPEKIIARRLANYNIKREECEIVNCSQLGEKHHEDYSKPLEVRFLCINHHRELHAKELIYAT